MPKVDRGDTPSSWGVLSRGRRWAELAFKFRRIGSCSGGIGELVTLSGGRQFAIGPVASCAATITDTRSVRAIAPRLYQVEPSNTRSKSFCASSLLDIGRKRVSRKTDIFV